MKDLMELKTKIMQYRDTGATLWGVELKYPEEQRDRYCEGYVKAMDRVIDLIDEMASDLIDEMASKELEKMYAEHIQEENKADRH